MRKIIFTSLLGLALVSTFGTKASAADGVVDYAGQPVVDKDLDGLTDEGEIQIFKTDPTNVDTDSDGYVDSVETLYKSNPNDGQDYPRAVDASDSSISESQTPWAWYISRATALIAFLLLFISIASGLTIRMPFVQRALPAGFSLKVHSWISLQALIFAFIHGGSLLFDKYLGLSIVNIFVPFTSPYQKNFIALGIIAFYCMLILVVTSYGRKYIAQRLWRVVHFLNIFLYLFALWHAFAIGTDLKNQNVKYLFIFANIFLLLLLLQHIGSRIYMAMKLKKIRQNNMQSQTPEN